MKNINIRKLVFITFGLVITLSTNLVSQDANPSKTQESPKQSSVREPQKCDNDWLKESAKSPSAIALHERLVNNKKNYREIMTERDAVYKSSAKIPLEKAKFLYEKVANNSKDYDEIFSEAAKSKDSSLVPYLKARMECNYDSKIIIEVTLVPLGETQYVDSSIEELKSDEPAARSWATWKLVRFKTKEAYRALYETLDDDRNRDPVPDDDAPIMPQSWVTKDILADFVDNPPKDRQSTAAWKDWFKNNHLIDD